MESDDAMEEPRMRPLESPLEPLPPAGRLGPPWLERCWADHAPGMLRAAQRVTGSAPDAEDVLQTVFLRLARRDEALEAASAGAYLHRAAVHAALDLLRSRHRAGWVPLEAAGEPAGAGADPERDRRSAELGRHLRLALARLSPRAAEAFALRYFEGLDNPAIARLLGTSTGVVAVLLHRTRARLRRELAALWGDRP